MTVIKNKLVKKRSPRQGEQVGNWIYELMYVNIETRAVGVVRKRSYVKENKRRMDL